MTDAVFSFGTEGLDSLLQVENALKNLARVSTEFGTQVKAGMGTGFVPPNSIAEIDALIAKLAQAEEEVAGLQAESATESAAIAKALATLSGAADQAIRSLEGVKTATAAYSESEIAIMKAAEAAKANAQAARDEETVIRSRAATTRADTEAVLANIDAQEKAAAAAARTAERSTFGGGIARGARRSGDTLSSGLGYNIARQGEFALGMVAQFAAFDAGFESVKQVKEYQKGVADLNIAMNEGKPVAQQYLNTLADLSRQVGENAHEAFDSASAGVRAFGPLLAERQGRQLSTQQKQDVGLAVTQSATRLGVIGGEGQNVATDQIVAIGTAYGLQAAELSQVTDAIAATKRFVGGEPGQIASGLARFAKSGSNAGLDINGSAALIGLIQARTGESGDSISTSLSRILQTTSGTSGIKLASEFASNPTVAPGDRRILANTDSTAWQRLQALSDIFRGGDTSTQNRILSVVGGVRNRAEASSLLGEMPLLNQFNSQFNGNGKFSANGQGLQQFNQQMQTLEGTIKRIQGDLKNIASDVGQSGLGDALGGLAHAVDPLLRALDEALRLLGQLENATHGGSGLALGGAELVGGAALYGKLRRGGLSGGDVGLDGSASALTGAAASLEAAAASLQGAAVAEDGAAEALDGAATALDAGAAAGAEGGLLGKFGGAKGAGIFGGLGLMMAGGFISDGRQGSTRNNAGNILGDAGAGAAIGSFIEPGIGTAIGGGLGALVGAVQSGFQTSAANKANEATLGQAEAAAKQNLAAGNFAAAVKDFQSAAGELKGRGDSQGAQNASDRASVLAGLKGDGTADRLKRLTTPVTPAGTDAISMAQAGQEDIERRRRARRLISHLPKWNETDLSNSIYGNAITNMSDGDLRNLLPGGGGTANVNALMQQLNADRNDPNRHTLFARDEVALNHAQISAHKPLSTDERTSAAAALQKAVEKAVQESRASKNKELTSQQITSIVKNALPGLGTDQINALIPKIKQTLDGLAKGDGVAGAMNAIAKFNVAAAPEIVASIDQVRKAHLKLAKTQSEMRAINKQYGAQEVKAAGNNAGLIAQVFSNLDSQTIAVIRAAAIEAVTAAKKAAQMRTDVDKALAEAEASAHAAVSMTSAGLADIAGGSANPSTDALNQAQQHLDAINSAIPSSGGGVSLPSGGGGGGGGHKGKGKPQYDFRIGARAEAIAARQGSGEISEATAALISAREQIAHNKKGSAAYWNGVAALWQAKEQLAKAEIDNAQTSFLLKNDFTNPVTQARAAVNAALQLLKHDQKARESSEVINKDKLSLAQAQAASDRAVFDQEMSNMQVKVQLGQISQAAYVRFLNSELTSLQAIKHRTQQQQDELNEVATALQQANDSMNAQFNLTSIDARGLVYQVRAMGQIAGSSAGAIAGAGIMTNSNNTTININVGSTAQIQGALSAAQSSIGSPVVTTRVRRV